MVKREIKFEELLDNLKQLKDIKVDLTQNSKRALQRKRSTLFGGSSWRSGGMR
tara:strand:- start:431 stop:589 length:159 start_codon:yes stop_codon:yes gene_type:complete